MTWEYEEKAVSRINEIKNYFNNQNSVKSTNVVSAPNTKVSNSEPVKEPSIDDIIDTDLDDFDIDSL